ncbi:MAG: hypothetical protein ACKV2V_25455 [Blastocatellia bacterium]
MPTGSYNFLPFVRQGAAAEITTPDNLAATTTAQGPLPVRVNINGEDASMNVRLYGPGHVLGIDPRQVIRTHPRHLSAGFEPNLFPLIEFDRPDFPWIFTPLGTAANDRLRPWLCLVVVRKQDGVTLGPRPGVTLPVLDIRGAASPARELPDLAESWAWAHAQVSGNAANAAEMEAAIRNSPERTVSRLLCPRRLDPRTAYIACVVPAFEIGVRAGLGVTVTDAELARLAPAWKQTDPTATLPVYYQWEFTTGEEGDFESLVRRLKPNPFPPAAGVRGLDISRTGFGIPPQPGVVLPLPGVLQPVRDPNVPATPPGMTAAPSQALRVALAGKLNAPADAQQQPHAQAAVDPLVGPPVYGARHLLQDRVNATPPPANWMHELNLDPRHRVAAGIGTQVIQHDQEQLMTAAWRQVEAVKRANAEQRHRQLALATREQAHQKHFQPLAAAAGNMAAQNRFLQLTGPVQASVLVDTGGAPGAKATMAWKMQESEFPAFSSPALRRVARPRGPINRRAQPPGAMAAQPPLLLTLFKAPAQPTGPAPRPPVTPVGPLSPVNPVLRAVALPRPAGKVNWQMVATAMALPDFPFFVTPEMVRAAKPHPQFRVRAVGGFNAAINDYLPAGQTGADNIDAAEFRQAAALHLEKIPQGPGAISLVIRWKPDTGVLLGNIAPRVIATRPTTVGGGGVILRALRDVAAADMPVMAHPQFPRPMYETIRDLAPDYLFPGLNKVAPDTAALLQTNPAFIEAFMAGLNHEMGRELLWREYPTDQRGTYFHHFWDACGAVDPAGQTIPDIHTWGKPLGRNAGGSNPAGQIVLLIRGELLRRYPGAILYAARAVKVNGRLRPGPEEKYPLFRGWMDPDLSFTGFDLPGTEVKGGTATSPDGWFFIIQQQPGEPNFGFDVSDKLAGDLAKATDWDQITWGHLAATAQAYNAMTHVPVRRGTPPLPDTTAIPPGTPLVEWGRNAAHMARVTLQKPVRVAIHARRLLGKP